MNTVIANIVYYVGWKILENIQSQSSETMSLDLGYQAEYAALTWSA